MSAPGALLAAHRREDGQTAIMFVLLVLFIFGVGSLSLDMGLWYFDHRIAQNQADAAALAGVLEFPASGTETDADARANALAAVNDFLQRNGTGAATLGACPTSDDSNHVEFEDRDADGESDTVIVCVRRQSPAAFASLLGLDFIHVSAAATAELAAFTVPYSLMAMNETECRAFWLTGNGLIHVTGTSAAAGTYTRSDCANEALATTGDNSLLESEGVNDVYGGANSRCEAGQCDPDPTSAEWLEDPFEHVPAPSVPSPCNLNGNVNNNQTRVLTPGCYSRFSVQGTARLQPGVYILTGGLSLSAGATLTADANGNGVLDDNEQVMFYVTCPSAPCNPSHQFTASGSATFQLQGIKGSPQYENIAIFVARNFGSTAAVDLSGQGGSTMSGAIYAIDSNVTITGNGTTLNLNIAVVADTLKFAGNGNVNVTYDIELIPPLYRVALTN